MSGGSGTGTPVSGGLVILSSTSEYDMIRALLGVSETELPDATIELSPFLPIAEAIVKQGITTYATILTAGGDNSHLLKAGTAGLAAALLCQAIERGDSAGFRVGEYEETGNKVDWRAKAQELLTGAKRALGAISTRTFTRRTLVAVAGPTRSGGNVPAEIEQWVEKVVPRFVDWVEEGEEDDDWDQP